MAALKLIKQVKNAALYEDVTSKVRCIYYENVRASYPFVGTPGRDENDDGEAKDSYRIVGMLPKATHKEAYELTQELIKELLTQNDVKVPSAMWFLQDGDGEKYEEAKYDSFHGHWLVSAKDGQRRPTARDRKGQVMDDIKKIDETFYGGVWVNFMIRPWYFNGKTKNSAKTYPKRILAGFQSIQHNHDDKPFGNGRIDDSDVYGAVEGAGDGMDDDDAL